MVQRPGASVIFCLGCGGVWTGRTPGKLLGARCEGLRTHAGREQLRLISQGQWSHYRHGHQHETLEGPRAFNAEETGLLESALGGRPAARARAAAAAPVGRATTEPLLGVAARRHLLAAFGLNAADFEAVRERGRREAVPPGSEDEEFASDEE